MTRVKVAPSFLTADLGRLADEVHAVERAGAPYLHLDVMDGQFVPPISFGGVVVEAIRRITALTLDIHLMVAAPERQIETFARAGGDILNVHVEACDDPGAVIDEIRSLECRAGVCLNPETPTSTIDDILARVDQVIVMGVNPGWGGQRLIEGTLTKVSSLREQLSQRGLTADIEIDGGVKVSNAASCVQAGADVLVAGSVIFNDTSSVEENMRELSRALADS
jgi:ribulose-phosphate 3-epimerase